MIGIFGGTFDPVHHGHLRIALDAAQAFGLERVHLIPLNQAVHREQPIASAEQRLQMLKLAVGEHPILKIDDREIRRSGNSYMVDTLQSLQQDYPEEKLCLLLGTDAFNGFAGWREPEQILQLAHIAVLQRPGYQPPNTPELQKILKQHQTNIADMQAKNSACIVLHDVTQLDISSSQIRTLAAQQQPLDYLLPSAVIQYIQQEKRYISAK